MSKIKCYAEYDQTLSEDRQCKYCDHKERCMNLKRKLFCNVCEIDLYKKDITHIGAQHVPNSHDLYLYNCKRCQNTLALKEKLNLG